MHECLIAILGGIGSFLIPYLAYQYANYKRQKRGNEPTEQRLSQWVSMVAALIGIILAFVAVHEMPLWQGTFCILFYWFAVFGICVDSYIRIIGNEMLLAMLVLGICYRFLEGGIASFLGSMVGLAITIALFAAAAGITYIRRLSGGVGMGDVKLAMVISITVGWPNVRCFLGGMAAAMVAYIAICILFKKLSLHSTFPMCGPIMVGFLLALYQPQMQAVFSVLWGGT